MGSFVTASSLKLASPQPGCRGMSLQTTPLISEAISSYSLNPNVPKRVGYFMERCNCSASGINDFAWNDLTLMYFLSASNYEEG